MRVVAAALCLAMLLAGSPSHAQDVGIAEQLFLEGKALMVAKKYEAACEKLKASHDLDRTATGTLLNLALCHELTNKPATAWAEFRVVASESANRREDRATLAREHEAKLAPILSYVKIDVPASTRTKGLTVQIDEGRPMSDATWGTELAIDPGPHVLHVSAPRKRPRAVEFVIGAVSDRKTVLVEPLADAPADAGPADAAEARQEARSTRRLIGFALGGAGLLAAGVGVFFGITAANKNDESKHKCDANDVCPTAQARVEASDALASANNAATVANVTIGVGSVLLAGGLVLVLTALPETNTTPGAAAAAKPARLRAAPVPIPNGGAFLLQGAF